MKDKSIDQKLFDQIHGCIYHKLNELRIKYVDHGDTFIIGDGPYNGKKIKIEVKIY